MDVRMENEIPILYIKTVCITEIGTALGDILSAFGHCSSTGFEKQYFHNLVNIGLPMYNP